MATVIRLKLKDGPLVTFGRVRDPLAAANVKRNVEEWMRDGVTVTVTNARGELVEINLKYVETIELADDATPPTGSRVARDNPLA